MECGVRLWHDVLPNLTMKNCARQDVNGGIFSHVGKTIEGNSELILDPKIAIIPLWLRQGRSHPGKSAWAVGTQKVNLATAGCQLRRPNDRLRRCWMGTERRIALRHLQGSLVLAAIFALCMTSANAASLRNEGAATASSGSSPRELCLCRHRTGREQLQERTALRRTGYQGRRGLRCSGGPGAWHQRAQTLHPRFPPWPS